MKKLILFLLCMWFVADLSLPKAASRTPSTPPSAQPVEQQRGIVALSQALKELANPYTLVNVATSLDDVDFPTLAYCHQKLGAHIAIVLATGGEPFEDSPSPSPLSQTQRLLQAAQAVNADLYLLQLSDRLNAASAEAVLRDWQAENAGQKLVQAIRWLRPDTIIGSSDGKTGTSGQQALGRLLIEAFDSAADLKAVPAADAEAWQSKRLFLRTDAGNAEVIINSNELEPLRGRTYAQAVEAAPTGATTAPLTAKSFYRLALSATGEARQARKSFFEGFTLPEKLRLSVTPPVVGNLSLMEALTLPEKLVEALTGKLLEKRAEGSINTLRDRYGKEFFRVVRFTENLERAIALALGIRCELGLSDPIIAQGEAFTAQFRFHNDSNLFLSMVFHTPASLPIPGKTVAYQTSEVISVAPANSVAREVSYEVAKDAPPTLPAGKTPVAERYYPASVSRFSQQPFGNILAAYAEVNLGQVTLTLPVLQRYQVAEPFEISLTPAFAFVKDWGAPREVQVVARLRKRQRSPFAGALWIVPLALQSETYEPMPLRFSAEDEEAIVKLNLRLPIMRPPLSPDILLELRREKPASPAPLASIKIPIKALDCEVAPDLRVGVIADSDSQLLPALAVLGVETSRLSVNEIGAGEHGVKGGGSGNQRCGNLSRFDTVIVDALGYSRDPDLLAKNHCLLEYARGGGNLLVLYQRPGFWNSVFNQPGFAPYPIRLSNRRIAGKGPAVTLLPAEHPLLSKPNRLEGKDFQDWSNELAIYLPQEWAGEYQALLETTEANQPAERGSLLYARYGEGSYVYASLNFHRQWPDANAGAYRLFANLLSLPRVLKEQGSKQ